MKSALDCQLIFFEGPSIKMRDEVAKNRQIHTSCQPVCLFISFSEFGNTMKTEILFKPVQTSPRFSSTRGRWHKWLKAVLASCRQKAWETWPGVLLAKWIRKERGQANCLQSQDVLFYLFSFFGLLRGTGKLMESFFFGNGHSLQGHS